MNPVAEPVQKRPRLPEWFRVQLPTSSAYFATRNLIDDLNLHTVCESARCPNHWECWSKGTATFMIAGDRCTRACGFCAVDTRKPMALDFDEPDRVAEATRRMQLKHVVITAVARDDLADGGAEHFRTVIRRVREMNPEIVIEVLTPDFQDDDKAIETVLAARPEIFNHNLETVRRLTPSVGRNPNWDWSNSPNPGSCSGLGKLRVNFLRRCMICAIQTVTSLRSANTFNPPINISRWWSSFILISLRNISKPLNQWVSSTLPAVRLCAVHIMRMNLI